MKKYDWIPAFINSLKENSRIKASFVLVFSFLLLASERTAAQLSAGFYISDSTIGCGYKVLHFQSTSTGYTSLRWNLGNGAFCTLDSASTSYTSAGSYSVSLTAYNGTDSSVFNMPVTLYPNVNIGFFSSDTAVCPGSTITFHNTSTSVVPGPITYRWAINGRSFTTENVSDTFNTPGYYTIFLTATNSLGCSDHVTSTNYIHIYNRPTAGFTTSAGYLCKAPFGETLTNTSTGSAPLSYTWNFVEDGTSFSDTTHLTNYTYTTPHLNNHIKLSVTDIHGCRDSITSAAIVLDTLVARFTSDVALCRNAPVTFTNSSNKLVTSTWSFGDGTSRVKNTDTVQNIYNVSGTDIVRLIVNDGHCRDTAIHTITVHTLPTPGITSAPRYPCTTDTAVMHFYANGNYTSSIWTFNDGTTSVGDTVTRSVLPIGINNVSLMVTDSNGCTNTVAVADTIFDLNLVLTPGGLTGYDGEGGCTPFSAHFSASLYTTTPVFQAYPASISSVWWSFGNGDTLSGYDSAPAYTYHDTGTYEAYAKVITSNGCFVDEYANIQAENPPVASFNISTHHVCNGQSVVFTPTGLSSSFDQYIWHMGDGTKLTTTGSHPVTYTFKRPGTFTDTMYVYKGACSVMYIDPVPVVVDSPLVSFTPVYNCNYPDSVSFSSTMIGVDSFVWNFGDGILSSATSPVHIFSAVSSDTSVDQYSVTLIGVNAASGCRDTASAIVKMFTPRLACTFNDTSFCKGSAFLAYRPTAAGLNIYNQYDWYINDSLQNSTIYWRSVFTDTILTSGNYALKLIATDVHGCHDTVQQIIHIGNPIDSFTVNSIRACGTRDTVVCTDITSNIAGRTIANYSWRYQSGVALSSGTSIYTHTYPSAHLADSFSITEIVTDSKGCVDSSARKVFLYNLKASFTPRTKFPCIGIADSFTNLSAAAAGAHLTYFWNFGDGSTSTVTSPKHIFNYAGIYTVTLTANDTLRGCTKDTAIVVTVTKTSASIIMSDSVSICYPMTVHFSALCSDTGTHTYSWNVFPSVFYDTSDVSFTYTYSGYNTITLIAANSHGCADTVISHVKIFGYTGDFMVAPHTGSAPLTVTLGTGSIPGGTTTWDLGDGTTAAGSDTIVETYTLPGIYIPKLFLANDTGCTSISNDTIKVDLLSASFTALHSGVCLGASDSFINTSGSLLSSVVSSYWSFGDGDTSSQVNPVHVFVNPGTYNVSLTVTNAWGASQTTQHAVQVFAHPSVSAINHTSPVCEGAAMQFFDTLGAAIPATFSWTGPGGYTSIVQQPTIDAITSAMSGTYYLTVTDINGCLSSASVAVDVLPQPLISPITGAYYVCQSGTITLSDAADGGMWLSSDTTIANITAFGVVSPVSSGDVDIQYVVTNVCGSVSAHHSLHVNPSPYAGTINSDIHEGATLCNGITTHVSDSGATYAGAWSVSDAALAVIDSAGMVTGVSATNSVVIITYSVHSTCGSAVTTYALAVNGSPAVSPITGSSVCPLSSVTVADATAGGAWSTTGAHTSISAAGVLSGLTPGIDTISYSLSNVCGTTTVSYVDTVLQMPAAGILTAATTTLCIGESVLLVNTSGVYSTSALTTLSGSSATAIEVAAHQYEIHALAAGATDFVFTATNSCGSAAIGETFIVNDFPSISAITGTDSVHPGAEITLHTGMLHGDSFSWNVSSSSIASVVSSTSSAITILASATGSFYAVFTANNSCGSVSDSFLVNCTLPVIQPGTIFGLDTICTGMTAQLADTTADVSGTWSSSNTSVAIVSSTGLVSGIGAGTAVISYAMPGAGGYYTTKVVSVRPIPQLISPVSLKVCDSSLLSYTALSSISGSSFKWSRAYVDGIANASASVLADTINEYLYNSTSAPLTVIYQFEVSAGGCYSFDSVTVKVEPKFQLLSPISVAICSGAPITYNPTSNVDGIEHKWGSDLIKGLGNINTTLWNNATSPAIVTFSDTLVLLDGVLSCQTVAEINFTVLPVPAAPVINTHPAAELCSGAAHVNFGSASLPPSGVEYTWSATGGGQIDAQGATHQYALADFPSSGSATVYLTASFSNGGCVSSDSFAVQVGSAISDTPQVIYFNNEFVCLRNDMDTYQWGTDDRVTLDSSVISNETNQNYTNTAPDLDNKYYWVITTHNGCMQKSYYKASPTVNNGGGIIKNMLKVFPNPSKSTINIEFDGDTNAQYLIQVIDMLGRIQLTKELADNKTTVDVSDLQSGPYYLDCFSNGIRVATAKFAKN